MLCFDDAALSRVMDAAKRLPSSERGSFLQQLAQRAQRRTLGQVQEAAAVHTAMPSNAARVRLCPGAPARWQSGIAH